MRSWYLVMSIFIGVFMILILLFSSLNNGCTIISGSLMTTGYTPGHQLKYQHGENALPWQLDAVSIGAVHIPAEKDILSTPDVQEISCMDRKRPMKYLVPKTQG